MQVEIALIFQRSAACGALETLNMEIFILNSDKHTANEFIQFSCVVFGGGKREKCEFRD